MPQDKLSRWLNRVEEGKNEKPVPVKETNGTNNSPAPIPPSAPSDGAQATSGSKLERWLARSGTADRAVDRPAAPPPAGATGLSACCNLIRLLRAEELMEVNSVVLSSMQEKGVEAPNTGAPLAPLSGSTKLAPPSLADVADSSAALKSVLEGLSTLAAEAGQRRSAALKQKQASQQAPATNQTTQPEQPTSNGSGKSGSKLDRWLQRAKEPPQDAPKPPAPTQPEAGAGGGGGGKLDRWLKRAQTGTDEKGVVAKKDTTGVGTSSNAADQQAADASGDADGCGVDESVGGFVERCFGLVRASWAAVDALGAGYATADRQKLQEEKKALDNLMAMVYAIRSTPAEEAPGDTSNAQFAAPLRPQPPPGAMGMGMPPGMPPGGIGGPNGMGGMPLQQQPGVTAGGEGPGMSASEMRAQRVQQNDPNALLQEFLRARRQEREQETAAMVDEKKNPKKEPVGKGWRAGSPMASAAKPPVPVHVGFNRPMPPPAQFQPQIVMMGPPPEGGPSGVNSQADVMNKEGGGFFFYPPGHPNHVPGSGPPGMPPAAFMTEGQLRSTVHPQERIAPHWSEAKFRAHGMPEVICEARHATFGPLVQVTAKLVRCNPPQANSEIKNLDQVKGNIVYIKRGGCSFTKKARMAQIAGAKAMVVANSDRETFGMSFTDDGEPLENIQIPCVMISSDVCEKLESCRQSPDGKAPWTCTLIPLSEKSPLFQQHVQMQQIAAAANCPPGAAIAIPPQMLQQPPPQAQQQGASPSGKKPSIVKRLKSMLP